MSHLVAFRLANGDRVVARVTGQDDANPYQPPESGGIVTRGWRDQGGRVIEQAHDSFEKAIGRIRPAAEAILIALTSLADAPDEVAVEFGIELSAEAGVVIANVGSTANFKVALTWKRTSVPVPSVGTPQ
jgi:hypothetical protein